MFYEDKQRLNVLFEAFVWDCGLVERQSKFYQFQVWNEWSTTDENWEVGGESVNMPEERRGTSLTIPKQEL